MKLLDLIFGREKKEEFSFADFERARYDNPLIKQLRIDQREMRRTRHEMDEVFRMTKYCNDTVAKHSREIPHEDYAHFMLFEGMTAFLPISIKEFLGPFEGMIIMYNPFREAEIIEI
jgi:hypothetical protein